MKIHRILPIIYGVITAGVIAIAVLSFLLKTATDRMDAYQERRHATFLLADQLRQSSDDLTRLARTYVVTGDPRYEKWYWDVLAIRNGKKPRPENYDGIYWDLVFDDKVKPRPDTAAVSLRELMERAGFTRAEFGKLSGAQKNSDDLVQTEKIAMNMVKGRYLDGSGNFTKTGAPDPETARTLMHDAAYHRTKASIMAPIGEFQKMLSERTRQEAVQSLKRTRNISWALQAILFGLFCSAALLFILKNRQQELERELSRSLLAEIEERKRSEAEKEKLQAQLQQSQKMEAVGRLAGGVAHDFNNLLTVITGYSELLLQKIGKESPMQREVEEIKRAGERAAALTQQLLAFSRKQIIDPKVLDLNLLTADLGKMLIRLIGENIDLRIVHGKNLGWVKVDPSQFEQVLINLAVNARDAMADGGTLIIETANVELDEEYCAQRPYQIHPGRFVRLAVSDTGHGMTGETSKQIFEPFFTTKAKGKGTGLGLSMIYGAVKQSGGSIEAYSEVGKGTTFKIYLPRVEGKAVKLEKDDRPTVLPGGTDTVLVVEDDDTVRNLCVQILERVGYKILQARNGTEAIALMQGYGDRIDLLLTDVVMPGMNGAELARQLVVRHPEMQVLFTSGYTDDAISRHGILDEGVSFIGKPYTPERLARKVREVLDKA